MTDQQQDENKLIAAASREAEPRSARTGIAFPNHFRRDVLAAELQDRLGDKAKEELERAGTARAVSPAGSWPARGPVHRDPGHVRAHPVLCRQERPARGTDWPRSRAGISVISSVVKGPVHKSGKGDLYVYLDERHPADQVPAAAAGEVARPDRPGAALPPALCRPDREPGGRARPSRMRSRIIDYIRRYFVDARISSRSRRR